MSSSPLETKLEAIAKRVQTSRAKLDNPNKPVGVFMLCGPSGVGKTETAMALAELMFAGEDSMIVINMSEFQEAHTVSTLKGAPAGYVGYGQGGVLTEAVREHMTDDQVNGAEKRLPSPRLGHPDDIAAMVAFLASDDAIWINGQVFHVNGGSQMRD